MFNNFYAQMNEIVSSLRDNASSNAPVTQFFKDSRLETAYALLRLTGEHREEALGITDKHYENKNVANAWQLTHINALTSLRDSGEITADDYAEACATLISLWENMVEEERPVVASVVGNFDNCQFYQVAGGDYEWRVWMLKSLIVREYYSKIANPRLPFTGKVWWVNPEIRVHGGNFKGKLNFDYLGLCSWVVNNECDNIDLNVLFSNGFYRFSIKEVLELRRVAPDLILIENLDDQNDLTQLINCYSGTKTVIGFSTQELLLSPGVNVVG